MDVEQALAALQLGLDPSVAFPSALKRAVQNTSDPAVTGLVLLGQAVKYSPHRWPIPTQLECIPTQPSVGLPFLDPVVASKLDRIAADKEQQLLELGLWLHLMENRGVAFPLTDTSAIRRLHVLPDRYWPLVQWVRERQGDERDLPLFERMPLERALAAWDHASSTEKNAALVCAVINQGAQALELLVREYDTFSQSARKKALRNLRGLMDETHVSWLTGLYDRAKSKTEQDMVAEALAYLGVDKFDDPLVDVLKSELSTRRTLRLSKSIQLNQPKNKNGLTALAHSISTLSAKAQALALGMNVSDYVAQLEQALTNASAFKQVDSLQDALVRLKIDADKPKQGFGQQYPPVPNSVSEILSVLNAGKPAPIGLQQLWSRAGTLGDANGETDIADRVFKIVVGRSNKGVGQNGPTAKTGLLTLDIFTKETLALLVGLLNAKNARQLGEKLQPFSSDTDILHFVQMCELNQAIVPQISGATNA